MGGGRLCNNNVRRQVLIEEKNKARRPLGKEAEGARMLEMVVYGSVKEDGQNGLIGKSQIRQR